MYIIECITHHVTIVKNNFDTILWLNLIKTLSTDVYLCIVYLWHDDSAAENYYKVELFDLLQNQIEYYENVRTVIVAWDFYSRVVGKNDYVEYDSFVSELDCDDYSLDSPLDRASQDKTSNARGNKL